MRVLRGIVKAGAALLLLVAGCGDDDATETDATSTSAEAPTGTTEPDDTSPADDSADDMHDHVGSSTTAASLQPGDTCELGSNPDCIDPDGDGVGTYLLEGAECMAALPSAPELCSDLDGDGVAGYPDSG